LVYSLGVLVQWGNRVGAGCWDVALQPATRQASASDAKRGEAFQFSAGGRGNLDVEVDSEEEFEEDMEEDVMDRHALKKQAAHIVDKGAKKKKPKRRRAKGSDD